MNDMPFIVYIVGYWCIASVYIVGALFTNLGRSHFLAVLFMPFTIQLWKENEEGSTRWQYIYITWWVISVYLLWLTGTISLLDVFEGITELFVRFLMYVMPLGFLILGPIQIYDWFKKKPSIRYDGSEVIPTIKDALYGLSMIFMAALFIWAGWLG